MCQGRYCFFHFRTQTYHYSLSLDTWLSSKKNHKAKSLAGVFNMITEERSRQADKIQLKFSKTPFMKTTLRPVISPTPRLTASLRCSWFLPSAAKHLHAVLSTNISQLSTTYPALGASDSKTNIYSICSGISFILFYQQLHFQ